MRLGDIALSQLNSGALALAFVLAVPILLGPSRVARAQDVDACIAAADQARALRKKLNPIDERASLSQCAAPSCPDQVSTYCRERLAEVNKAIPSIVFAAKDGSGRDLATVKLTIDGAPRGDHLDGTAIELNPGQHTFVFEAPGQVPVTRDFFLVEGERDRRERIVVGQPPRGPPEVTATPRRSGDGQKTAALLVAGFGVAALSAGGTLGGLTFAAHSGYERNCGSNIGAPSSYCNKQGVSGEQNATLTGNLATGFLIGGSILAAAGTLWYVLAPSTTSGVTVGVGPLALTLGLYF